MPAIDRGQVLLSIARATIAQEFGRSDYAQEDAAWLQEPGACFVTLRQGDELRGCIGTLEAHRSLLADIKANAKAAAFADPRFMPLSVDEFEHVDIEVSLLSALQPLQFRSEADALAQLRPGVDGVVFECGNLRSTFLPKVWEHFPSAAEFMVQLKRKCGLPAHFWADDVRLFRYSVSKFAEQDQPSIAERAAANVMSEEGVRRRK